MENTKFKRLYSKLEKAILNEKEKHKKVFSDPTLDSNNNVASFITFKDIKDWIIAHETKMIVLQDLLQYIKIHYKK